MGVLLLLPRAVVVVHRVLVQLLFHLRLEVLLAVSVLLLLELSPSLMVPVNRLDHLVLVIDFLDLRVVILNVRFFNEGV